LPDVANTKDIYVAPDGRDDNPGTSARPLRTLTVAREQARPFAGRQPVTVHLAQGTYYLPETLSFTSEDSGTAIAPVTYLGDVKSVVISGGTRLDLKWEPFHDGIMQAWTPPALAMDQLFVNGRRQHMARYPDYDPGARQFNGSSADAISPQRVARWADPAGGYIHAMHTALWGDMHWRILGKKPDGSLDYEGGWQNNRPSPMHDQFRFVENIREELDAPGEWFHDVEGETLYFIPPPHVDLRTATIEVVRLRHLVEFDGTKQSPVRFVRLRGLTFCHAARTFMENREPLLRSDWTVYRGGAVVLNGTEDVAIENCDFDQLGGNTVFVNNYNRRVAVRGCLIRESGANGIAFVGDVAAVRNPLFNYAQRSDYATIDRTPGPLTDNFPADCLVEDCLITRSGRFEKQTAPIEIDMAQSITVRHCSIYDVPRAGINIGDGCWGGHLIEDCDIFDTVMETGDHGCFNSWGRDRYWHPDVRLVDKHVAADANLPLLDMVKPTVIRNNRWRCDHGWDVDLDDGSSRYVIHNNLLLRGGLKLREGYHRTVTNNIIVGNSLHPHVWFENSGDVFTRNIVMGAYRPARMTIAKWGENLDGNLFTTSEADRTRFAANGCDARSLVGAPLFVSPGTGDFRVKDGSPAIQLGFVNFPMNTFGVLSPRLKSIARTPAFPDLRLPTNEAAGTRDGAVVDWCGARLKNIVGLGEVSAAGLACESGVIIVAAPTKSAAAHAGLREGDVILKCGGRQVSTVADFLGVLRALPAGGRLDIDIFRNQQPARCQFIAAPHDAAGSTQGG
jgi:hypothetical protein